MVAVFFNSHRGDTVVIRTIMPVIIRYYVHCFSLLLLYVFLRPNDVVAQGARIEGYVIDAETRAPLPGVNVFLDRTLRGSATDAEGYFEIGPLEAGSFKLVASMMGYALSNEPFEITPTMVSKTIHFELQPVVFEMDELVVSAERPRSWRRNLRRFKRLFLGTSSNASKTELLNPFVLDFATQDNVFSATASEALEIENRALGYHITFILTDFRLDEEAGLLYTHGPFYFRDLETENSRIKASWRQNREDTFRGSLQHLLRTMTRNNTVEEGFTVMLDRRVNAPYSREQRSLTPVDVFSILVPTDLPYLFTLRFRDFLFVRYRGEPSWIEINGLEATVHRSGYVYAPQNAPGSLTVHGALAKRRIADLLPRDYSTEKGGQ